MKREMGTTKQTTCTEQTANGTRQRLQRCAKADPGGRSRIRRTEAQAAVPYINFSQSKINTKTRRRSVHAREFTAGQKKNCEKSGQGHRAIGRGPPGLGPLGLRAAGPSRTVGRGPAFRKTRDNSAFVASDRALPSFVVPLRNDNHSFSLSLVIFRGQLPLSSCNFSSAEKKAASGRFLAGCISFFITLLHKRN